MNKRVKQYLDNLHKQINKARMQMTDLMGEIDGFNPVVLREALTAAQDEIAQALSQENPEDY